MADSPPKSPMTEPYHHPAVPARPPVRQAGNSYIEEINKYAPAFFEDDAMVRNVITIGAFQKFIPLFSKEGVDKLSPEALKELSYEYNQRFSAYHPIRVIDPNVIDEDRGFVWKAGDGKKHKVVHLIRARLRRLNTVDVVGREAGDIASSCMFNARQSNNPFDTRLKDYSTAVGKLVEKANVGVGDKQDAEFDAELKALRGGVPASGGGSASQSSSSGDDDPSVDCDWS